MSKTTKVILATVAVLIALTAGFFIFKKYQRPIVKEAIEQTVLPSVVPTETLEVLKERISHKFAGVAPKEWSESASGVKTSLNTQEKVIALTFDACGGTGGDGYDAELIDYLDSNQIPVTLFITSKWIDANPDTFKKLAENLNFEIENHGDKHIPCSVSGQSAYNIKGENNAGEVVDEIELNARKIYDLTGRRPLFYRAGTAYTDEICPQIAAELGGKVVNFNLVGDAGATYSADQVKDALLKARSGTIALLHMNHPEGQTAEGVISIIPALKSAGFKFVKLSDYELK